MRHTALRPDATLAELLGERAHAASDRRLMLDVTLGLLAAGGVFLLRPRGWPAAASAGLCFAAFGVWGLAERRLARERPLLAEPAATDAAWRAARDVAAVVGALAAVMLVLAVTVMVLGASWQS